MTRTGNRVPTRVKHLRGTARADRARTAPPLKPTAPDQPDWLDDRARTIWDDNVELLIEGGVLCKADSPAYAVWCQAFADVGRLTLEIRDEGETVETRTGGARRNPKCTSLKEAYDRLHKWSLEIGLSPASRGRLDFQPPPSEADLLAIKRFGF